jgi:hypothetical protein
MHELVFVALFFLVVGHLSSPFDPSPVRGVTPAVIATAGL